MKHYIVHNFTLLQVGWHQLHTGDMLKKWLVFARYEYANCVGKLNCYSGKMQT
jgi:hypothetical protein